MGSAEVLIVRSVLPSFDSTTSAPGTRVGTGMAVLATTSSEPSPSAAMRSPQITPGMRDG